MMATTDSTHPPASDKIPFVSPDAHAGLFAAGTIAALEDLDGRAAVALSLRPSGPGKVLRLLLSFDSALELAHQLIAAAARLRRGGGHA
jgi:hypothetical protein